MFLSQERRCLWQLPIRSCWSSTLRVASQLEAFTLSSKVTLTLFVFVCLRLIPMTISIQLQVFMTTYISRHLIVLIFSSGASYQRQPVQFCARASLRQTDRFRVLRWLSGPLRVQSRLSAERIQRHPLSGHARCPRTVECNRTNLYR